MTPMLYKKGYPYQLVETFRVQTPLRLRDWVRDAHPPKTLIETKYISLEPNGVLTIRDGYAWDGPSGPTVDTKAFVYASLPHDALYQLMRMDLLYRGIAKEIADRLLQTMYIEAWKEDNPEPVKRTKGIFKHVANATEIVIYRALLASVKLRAWYVYKSLKSWGEAATLAKNRQKTITAP